MSRLFSLSIVMLGVILSTGCDSAEATDAAKETAASETAAATKSDGGSTDSKEASTGTKKEAATKKETDKKESKMPELEKITFGAGCFWCVEAVFDRIEGIEEVTSGYMGGRTLNPTYKDICTGLTGHAEVVEVKFDPKKLPLDKLLDVFWQLHDPTTLNRQGPDVGTQYRSAIFYSSEKQKEAAEASKEKWNKSRQFRGKIVTEITEEDTFYPAEGYHQEYFAKNPEDRYCRYNILPKFKKLGLLKKSDR